MGRAVMGLVGGLMLMLSTAPVFADPTPPAEPVPIAPGPSNDLTETSVFGEIGGFIDDLNGGGISVLDQALQTLVFTCPLGSSCPGGIVIEQAGGAGDNMMGIYDLSDAGSSPDRVAVFVGADGAGTAKSFSFDPIDGTVIVGLVDTGIAFGSGTSFGLFIENPVAGNIFFSEDLRNTDGLRHVLIYHTETGGVGTTSGTVVPGHSYLFAFEDLPGPVDPSTGSDRDFNDFIYHFKIPFAPPPPPEIPEPASMLLFGLGGLGTAGLIRRQKKVQL